MVQGVAVGSEEQEKLGYFAERRRRHDRERYERALRAWTEEDDELRELIEDARGFVGSDQPVPGFVLKRGERVFLAGEGAALIEPRAMPGQYVGGSKGVSIRLMKGVSYRVGQSRGTYQPGPTRPAPVDTGTVVITDRRAIFRGAKANREWAFDKMVGYDHSEDWTSTAIQVSNRQRTSGIGYSAEFAGLLRFRLEFALATWRHDDRGPLVAQLGPGSARRAA